MVKKPEEWLNQADYDMDTSEYMFNGGRYIYAVFMCHLSIEKALKGLYQNRYSKIPPKTHNLLSVVRLRICVVIIFRMFFEIMLSKVSEVKISSLIVNLDSQFPDSFDRNFFSEIIVTVDC